MIPKVLREYCQWVVWKYTEKNGRMVKMPYDPKSGKAAKVNDPLTWATYSEACRVACHYDGLGFVFTKDDPFVGIDIDHCIDEQKNINENATNLLHKCNSYSEKSPSKKGIHIIVTGQLKDGRKGIRKEDIEIYGQDRYFTVTGDAINDVPVRDGQNILDSLTSKLVSQPPQKKSHSAPKTIKAELRESDERLLEKLFKQKNGDILQALYNGEDAWTGDRSRDDLYFCWNINFRNDNDLAQTDRIFRSSARMRSKWDEKHWSDGTTYGQRTLERSYNKG